MGSSLYGLDNNFVYLVVNSSTLWSHPLYGLDNNFVYLVVNSSTYGLGSKLIHFMDLVANLSALWT